MIRFSQTVDPQEPTWPFGPQHLEDMSKDPNMQGLESVQRAPWAFHTDFRNVQIFEHLQDNHEVMKLLQVNDVIPEDAVLDPESSEFYVYFEDQRTGLRFLSKLNWFMGNLAGVDDETLEYAANLPFHIHAEKAQEDPNAFTWKDVPEALETAYDLVENVDDPKYMDAVLDALRETDDPDERAVLETRLRMMSERMQGRESGGLINEGNLRRFKGRHPLRFAQEDWKRMIQEDSEGRKYLPPYAWPGGYTVRYVTRGGEILCAECANKELQEYLETGEWDSDDPIECYYHHIGGAIDEFEVCAACCDILRSDEAEMEREDLHGWKGGDPALEAEAKKVKPVILNKAPEEEAAGVSNPDVDEFLRNIDISDLYAMSHRALRMMAKRASHVQRLIEELTQDGIFTEDKGRNVGLIMAATKALREDGFLTTDLTPRRLVAKIRELHNNEV